LGHAYGSAADVLVTLRELVSPDPEVAERTLSALFGSIWHQGADYAATAYAVSPLCEIAQSPDTLQLASVIELLASIATGS
jgi:hypothetical protein